jgi:toxin ParE1/3/4
VTAVHYTRNARADLTDIWVHIALRDEATANRVIDTLVAACSQLGSFPELGRARPDIGPDVRSLVSERWLVLYRIEAAHVLVVRVVDGARDLSNVDLP